MTQNLKDKIEEVVDDLWFDRVSIKKYATDRLLTLITEERTALLKKMREIVKNVDAWKGYEDGCDENPSDAFQQGAGSVKEQLLQELDTLNKENV
jgi:hypothetical protein